MDSKPVVTFAGDEKLFESLKTGLIDGLPQESVEWRRSHMRNPKPVYVTANFDQFSEACLSKGERSLLGEAFFHTYWTQCNDIDAYKQTVKDDISNWLAKLKAKKIYDWLIVVVDQVDNRKVNKTKLLPRTTVIDKIKNDFPSQGAQRCISLLDPCRSDSRAAESWQLLLQRIRKLILQAYSRQLSQFEEHMRTQRERRNEAGWKFQDFFFLQEELAFVLEMLGLYDEALVQYDELDALFTQFVINSNAGDMPEWLSRYSRSCDLWSGICLLREKYTALREILRKGEACLLDLRNYLFSRQCALLLLLCRPWEVAQRSLPFLHNCISELRIMEISMPVGSVACWVFLSCLEVLQTCEKFSDTSQIKAYSLYTAGLWAYAREKLHELGLLCGLMPDQEATSDHLQLVVSLLSGMGPDPYPEINVASPHAKLREALSSKESFLKHYMELSELTMGTFKHNRRIRTARLIGKDLAELYMKLKQPQKAAVFLVDLLKTYKEENWEQLTVQTQKDLFECYREMEDTVKYLKTSIRLAATCSLTFEERQSYFQEVISNSPKLESEVLHLATEKVFSINEVHLISSDTPIVSSSELNIALNICSSLPQEIICRYIKVLLKHETVSAANKQKLRTSQIYASPRREFPTVAQSPVSPMQSGMLGIPSREELPPRVLSQPQLVVNSYNQLDGTLVHGVVCKNNHQLIRRRDSQAFRKDKEISEEEILVTCKVSGAKLIPGNNEVLVSVKATEPGLYTFNRMWMEWGNIHFTLHHLPNSFTFLVVEEPLTVTLKPEKGELLAGIEQQLNLTIFSGSSVITPGTVVSLKPPEGLKLKSPECGDTWLESIDVPLPEVKPFQTVTLPLSAISSFKPQKNPNTIEHRVLMQCSLSSTLYHAYLHFLPPFLLTHKLQTCGVRKYIQIVAHGMTPTSFVFKNSKIQTPDGNDVFLKHLNAASSLVVNTEQTASFIWEIMHEDADEEVKLPIKFVFCTDYELKDVEPVVSHSYTYEFKFSNYMTLYAVRARVEPTKGSEFCRAGIMCYLHISINQITHSVHTSLMYEVVADQEMWAVCGRTAGVVNIDTSGKHSVTLEVMPLIGGFLPLPSICLSKYIPAESHKSGDPLKEGPSYNTVARLEPFDPGQVYSWSRAMQVHVLPGANAPCSETVS